MSTRSIIGKVLDDTGKCKVIYCHSDGYIEKPGVGWTLQKYYQNEKDVDKLLELGDLSFLGEVPEDDPELWKDLHHSNKCRTYKGRGDKGVDASIFESPRVARKEMGQEYDYFYLDGKWYCLKDDEEIIDLETGENIKKRGKKMESLLNEKIIRRFSKKWIEDENHEIVEVQVNGKSIKKGDKVGDDFVTGFNPETNTIYLDEDPEVDGGRDYDVETILSFLEEKLEESEEAKVEDLNKSEEDFEDLNVGDKVIIQDLEEDSPWEGLDGEITWIDEEDFGDEFQTIAVRVNFPTLDGTREVEQNFDRRNIKKISVEEEEIIDTEEPLKEEVEEIEMPHEEYALIEDIIRINEELDRKARNGELIGLRQEKDMIMLSEPAINGIWTLFLNDKGEIIKITLW